MKNLLLLATFLFSYFLGHSQTWVDTLYQIQQVNAIPYGQAISFAGEQETLELNLAYPTNDTPPSCGRPLMVIIHGGAFLAGDKNADLPPRLLNDFAKRGYVTASINYRLGMFQTNSLINCNVSWALGSPWNCLNMQDTAEWYRAAYRGMQDAKGAIRWLVQHASSYHIDPKNIFVVGESAGGFIALETAFLDDVSEKPVQAAALSDALPPNTIYESQCIVTPGFSTSIAALQLQRPDLGPIEGNLNVGGPNYQIKGVGNFYGGMFTNLFTTSNATSTSLPRIYFFHQPNDLVVPYTDQRVLEGTAYCYTQWPANCQWLINRPNTHGSKGMTQWINALPASSAPNYYFDSTNNMADCAAQIANPSLTGHAVDNYWLRTQHMAAYFAPAIDTSACVTHINTWSQKNEISIFPNPISNNECQVFSTSPILEISLVDMRGLTLPIHYSPNTQRITFPTIDKGIYLLQVRTPQGMQVIKLLQ